MNGLKTIRLVRGAEKRILRGHRWIFSNEVGHRLSQHEPGSWVKVESSKGVALGCGYVNPHSLIAVRLVGSPGEAPGDDLFAGRIERALEARTRWYPASDVYRLVFGESDGLPGLVVDRYGEVIVYQVTTLGMAGEEERIRRLLGARLRPRCLVYRNDSRARLLEGLPLEKGIAQGRLATPVSVRIGSLDWLVDPLEGQKTGMYLDQRDNRADFSRWFNGRTVLDLFCYDGSWGACACAAGAKEVVAVDQSRRALDLARENARRNGLGGRCRFVRADVFEYLKHGDRNRFDVVVLDPPAFVKKKKMLKEAMKGYVDLNRRAMLLLKRGGLLISCSCSYHLHGELFRDVLLRAAKACGRTLRLLEARGQALDHPVLLAMPETRYLKCYLLEVS